MIFEETVKSGDIARAVRFGSPVHEIAKQLSRSVPEYVTGEARGIVDQLWGATSELDAGAIVGALITYYIALGVVIAQNQANEPFGPSRPADPQAAHIRGFRATNRDSAEPPNGTGEGARVWGVGPLSGSYRPPGMPVSAEGEEE